MRSGCRRIAPRERIGDIAPASHPENTAPYQTAPRRKNGLLLVGRRTHRGPYTRGNTAYFGVGMSETVSQHSVFYVEGMCCADEQVIIEKKLRSLAGIEEYKFNLVA